MKTRLATLLLLVISFDAYALSNQEQQDSITSQDQIIQRQQQFEQDQLRQKQLQQIEKEQEKIKQEETESNSEKEVENFLDIRCFRITKIVFLQNTILSETDEKELGKSEVGRCLTVGQITEFSKKISDFLIEKGYVTSRAEIPSQNLSNGALQVLINESYLKEINFNDEKFFDKMQKITAFGFVKEKQVLNLKKIEQGLEQINRLQSNSATIKILPSEEKKFSVIAIENHPKNQFRPSFSMDNNGSKTTGKKRETIGFSQDNFFQLNDNFSLSRTANSLDSKKDSRGTKAISSSFSIPFSWYTLTLSYSKSSYYFWSGSTTSFKSSGSTSTKTATFDRLLFKSKRAKFLSSFGLTSKYNQSFIDDTKLDVSSKKASTGLVAFSATFFFENANLFLKPSYNKSLKILDAKKDSSELSSNSAHAQFDIFKFYGNYAQKLQIAKTPISYNLSFDSQVSQQRLYSVDQFYVGGIYTVRGFSEGSIYGDSGYNIKNELNFNLGQATLPYVNFFSNAKLAQYFGYFSITPFYDYGYVRYKGGQTSGRLSGSGLKIGFNHKNLNASLSFSRVNSRSQLLQDDYHEDRAIYFAINSEFGFF